MDVRTRFEQVQSRASRAASVAGRRLDTLRSPSARRKGRSMKPHVSLRPRRLEFFLKGP